MSVLSLTRSCVLLCACAAAALLASSASAQTRKRFGIELQAPVGCPSQRALEQSILRDLAANRGSAASLEFRIRVVADAAEQWRARIEIRSPEAGGERNVTAHSCEALFNVMSLVIATLLDPTAAPVRRSSEEAGEGSPDKTGSAAGADTAEPLDGDRAEARTAPLVAQSPRVSPGASEPAPSTTQAAIASDSAASEPSDERDTETPSADERVALEAAVKQRQTVGSRASVTPTVPDNATRSSADPVAARLAAWAAWDDGSLPGRTLALGASVGLVYRRFSAELYLGGWWPKAASLSAATDPSAAGGRFDMLAGGAKLFFDAFEYEPSRQMRFAWGPCAGFEIERWNGSGNASVTANRTAQLWGSAVSLGVFGRLRINEWIAFRAMGEAALLLDPPAFGFLSAGAAVRVFRPDELVFRLASGIELQLR